MFEVQKLFQVCQAAHDYEDIASHKQFLVALGELGINVKDYPEHHMVLLDYDQIECVKNHPVVNECRGLLMGYDGSIIRKGFTRFYNLGENGVDTFDFENSIAFEKADGSLTFVYYCPSTDQWELGTRGTAFAEGPNEWYGTFRNFMLAAMGRTEAEFQKDCSEMFSREYTYLFESIGPDNRIVTPYKENMLVELGCIHNLTGEDYPTIVDASWEYCEPHPWNIRPIRNYKFNTQEDCMIALHELTGLQEGYVVWNRKTGERVKIKNAAYLAAHRLRGQNGLTNKSICELVAMNEQDEYLAVFPEDVDKFKPAEAALADLKYGIECLYNAAQEHMKQFTDTGRDSQKEFALFVKDYPHSAVLFKARASGVSVMEAFNSFPLTRRAEWIREIIERTENQSRDG